VVGDNARRPLPNTGDYNIRGRGVLGAGIRGQGKIELSENLGQRPRLNIKG